MRPAAIFVLASALSIVPRAALAQAVVALPEAGAQSSYRTTAISWYPIPGATSYHLEIDDDPNFGSPEVDVTVPGTSYVLSGERLKLHGQLTWAAYVRINGMRWNAGTFTPSYRGWGIPALAVNSENRVYLAFEDERSQIQLTTSSDWSSDEAPFAPRHLQHLRTPSRRRRTRRGARVLARTASNGILGAVLHEFVDRLESCTDSRCVGRWVFERARW